MLIKIFTAVRWIGIPTYGGSVAHCCAYILFGFLTALEIGAIWKLTRLLTGIATDTSDGRKIFYDLLLSKLRFD